MLIVNKSVDLFYNSVTRSFARRAIVVQIEGNVMTQNCERDWESNNTPIVYAGLHLGCEISQSG